MDDEFIIPELNVFSNNRYIKTYSKANRKTVSARDNENTLNDSTIPVVKNDPLTTKNAVQFLLDGTLRLKVCRYCLNVTTDLSELNQYLEVNGKGALYKVTISDMVASFHSIKVVDDPNFPNKICNKCLDRAISAYLFTQQCERAERALRNCFDDMYEKTEKLDPLEKQKRRGRQKLNPNYNTLHAEHGKVIDYAEPIINIINTASQSLTEEGPVKDYECLKCCQVLPTVDSLLNHERSHPKSMWYNCRLCGKSFPKRHLLKKHAITHSTNKPAKPSNNSFSCNRCGNISNDCNEYLHHIEKHRFKEVMEHLVEKKMDDLCSVCLDKSSNMMKLESMVRLHGGHTDLMGDRSLYSILASTIPDPKLYKYQELIIPSKANIVTIAKKHKIHAGNALTKPNFDFPQPIILTTDVTDFEDVYIFIFASPFQEILQIEEQKESNITDLPINDFQALNDNIQEIGEIKNKSEIIDKSHDTNDNTNTNVIESVDIDFEITNPPTLFQSEHLNSGNKIEDIKIPNLLITTQCDFVKVIESDNRKTLNTENMNTNTVEDKAIFTFSKPIYLDRSEKIHDEEITQEHNPLNIGNTIQPKTCKMCWIFKNKSCEECKKNQDPITVGDENSSKPCSYCWLFKCVDKCEYCKKPNEIVTNIDIGDHNTKELEKACNNTGIYEEIQNSLETANSQELYSDIEVKPEPWQCSICLTTNNTDRQTCYCCDCEVNANDHLKINFGQYGDLFNKSDTSLVFKDTIVEKYVDDTVNITSDKNIPLQEMEVESPINNVIDNKELNHKPEYLKVCKNPYTPEEMDVEESDQISIQSTVCTINEMKQDFPPLTIYQVNETKDVLNSYQFHIGSVSSEDKSARKLKRPLRKMSRVLHK